MTISHGFIRQLTHWCSLNIFIFCSTSPETNIYCRNTNCIFPLLWDHLRPFPVPPLMEQALFLYLEYYYHHSTPVLSPLIKVWPELIQFHHPHPVRQLQLPLILCPTSNLPLNLPLNFYLKKLLNLPLNLYLNKLLNPTALWK